MVTYELVFHTILMALVVAWSCHMVLQFIRRIEKQLVVPSTKKRRVVERKSLWLIKIVMKIIPVGVFIESVVYADWQWQSLLIGSVCVGVGLLLRINAIRALGEYWTFHPTMYYQPYRVETGVYRYFYHPAYLGNIWLVGLCDESGGYSRAVYFLPIPYSAGSAYHASCSDGAVNAVYRNYADMVHIYDLVYLRISEVMTLE
jgi:isoprenylcysteine carboxyl methyltransferase (ICMT) family protein YpbQ